MKLTREAFVVVRIDFKGRPDDAYLWTNPPLGSEPTVDDADVKTERDASFNTVVLRGDSNDRTSVDEVRIGATWTDVNK